jgi:riboflavin-specific deaminase-like protein
MGDQVDLPDRILEAIQKVENPVDRPLVTLSYAQSLDGSLAAVKGQRTQISGPESAKLTHTLRANHDTILIGIGTLLADDPRLTVRLAEGEDPKPVILDSRLQIPLDSNLVPYNPPWIATTAGADKEKARQLTSLGARLFILPETQEGWISLPDLVRVLYREGARRLMVEGGAKVISSFLVSQLVDFMVVTISPLLLGGVQSIQFDRRIENKAHQIIGLRMNKLNTGNAGEDLVVYGSPQWKTEN